MESVVEGIIEAKVGIPHFSFLSFQFPFSDAHLDIDIGTFPHDDEDGFKVLRR